jgi:hypothetical protein
MAGLCPSLGVQIAPQQAQAVKDIIAQVGARGDWFTAARYNADENKMFSIR